MHFVASPFLPSWLITHPLLLYCYYNFCRAPSSFSQSSLVTASVGAVFLVHFLYTIIIAIINQIGVVTPSVVDFEHFPVGQVLKNNMHFKDVISIYIKKEFWPWFLFTHYIGHLCMCVKYFTKWNNFFFWFYKVRLRLRLQSKIFHPYESISLSSRSI